MGLPVHPKYPTDPGEPCDVCEAGPWGVGHTPKTCRVVFRNVQITGVGPFFMNGKPWTLEQVPGYPCWFSNYIEFDGVLYEASYFSEVAQVYCTTLESPPKVIFNGHMVPCMAGPCPNEDLPPGKIGVGGSAVVLDLPVDYVLFLAETCNLQPDPDALYDITICSDPAQVLVRLVGRQSPGSCYIRFEL